MSKTIKLILHIGSEKTGSTSIQSFFYENRDDLIKRKIYYSRVDNLENHTFLLSYCLLNSGLDNKNLKSDILSSLRNDINQAIKLNCSFYVMSCELLSSHLNEKKSIKECIDLLLLFSKSVEVVCYLRPQVDLHISRMQTAIKNGEYINNQNFWTDLTPLNYYYNYYEQAKLWLEHNSDIKISFRPFKNKEVVQDFLKSIDYQSPPKKVIRKNQSADINLLAILNAVNYENRKNTKSHVNLIEDISTFERVSIDYETITDKERVFNETNQKFIELNPHFSHDELISNKVQGSQNNLSTLQSFISASPILNQLINNYNYEYYFYRLKYNFLELQLSGLTKNEPQRLSSYLECEKICREIKILGISGKEMDDLFMNYADFKKIMRPLVHE